MADERIKDIARTVADPKSAEYVETDHATDGTGKLDLSAWLSAKVNARATRGALAFDGTTNCRAAAPLTGQTIGTDDVSLVWFGKINATGEQYLLSVGPSTGDLLGGAGGIGLYITSGGHLQAGVQATAGYEYRRVANFQTAAALKEVFIAVTRSGATLKIYVNAVDTAHTAGDTSASMLAASISSAYAAVNFRGTNYSAGYVGVHRDFGVANCVLTQAQITEIFETGAVPESLKWGTQNINSQAGITWSNSNMATMTSTSDTGVACTHSSGQGNITAAFDRAGGRVAKVGQRFRVRATLTLNSGSAPLFITKGFGYSVVSGSATLAAGANDFTVEVTTAGDYRFEIRVNSASDFVISGLQIAPLGFIEFWSPDAGGAGYQLHGQGTNKSDAALTTSGASWTKPKITPNFFRGYTATAGNEQLSGTAIVRGPARVLNIYAKASGTATVTVGLFSAGTEFVASVALTAGVDYQRLTIKPNVASFYNGDGVVTNTNVSIWVNSSTANRIDWFVTWEPLNP